ncbi:MAG: hypothetical protein F4045_04540 [Chloroflexi bacterium]|nr:hypothetical protein [Chloroflexota bacterium]MYK34378.1 hypothetical protein [Chloroflexota bacterium]
MTAQPAPEMRLADRRKLLLTLGFPYVLLLLASLVEWPWRALDLPGVLGTLTPPSFILLVVTVGASTYALLKKLPLSMITWLPAGQGAIVLLATGLMAGGAPEQLTQLALIIAYGLIFLIVLGITTAIAAHGGAIAIAFISFFVFTRAARFPIFEVEDAVTANASLFTFAAAVLAVAEIVLMVWLARRLVEAADESAMGTALWIVGLTLAHGLLASWQYPIQEGSFNITVYGNGILSWLIFATIQLGMAGVLIRFRRAQFREQQIQQDASSTTAGEEQPLTEVTPPARQLRRGGRPTPRRRRR